MKTFLKGIFYSFPMRLFLLHLRSNLLLLLIWGILLYFIAGKLGQKLGAQYLFLDPEYLGQVNFWSFFLLGLAFGGFFMTWNLTTYLTSAQHFLFLATLLRPFTKFCINNFIIPVAFFVFYLSMIIYFQGFYESSGGGTIFMYCLGFLSGMLTLILLYFLYFHFTNRDISHYGKPNKDQGASTLIGSIAQGGRKIDLDKLKMDDRSWPTHTYLTESLTPRLVRSVAHYDTDMLKTIFKQNHLNALVIQLLGMLVLIVLGSLIDYPLFRIPAAASLFILFSIFTAITGAISYWFAEWKVPIFILFLLIVNYFTSFDVFNHQNHAYGLNYNTEPAPYSYDQLRNICFSEQVEIDKAATIAILNQWKANLNGHADKKPKMVILAASGGGLKSATWSIKVLQEADSLLGGKLLDHTVLITGASGGMMGMAYMRELYYRKKMGDTASLYHPRYLDDISRDLLNPVTFALVSNDLFFPWGSFQVGDYTYSKDRGYIFERQFNENTHHVLSKTLADYRQPEQQAHIPMMYITPSIINDARRLIISPQGVSFMMVSPAGITQKDAIEIDAVDFTRLFKKQNADQLQFLSALRMNSTFPYILPSVYLPSSPAIEIMDAGFRDNYGILSATRFIQVFKDWITENTSGVILLQISSTTLIEDIKNADNEGIIESLFDPFGIPGQLLDVQEFELDNSIGFIYDILGPEYFQQIRFIFRPIEENKIQASVSFHITEREKQAILNTIQKPRNQVGLRELQKIFSEE